MVRLLASCLLLLALASCNVSEATGPALPAGCRMITAADLSQLQIYVTRRDVNEAVDPRRSATTREPSAANTDASESWAFAGLRLSQDWERGRRECLGVGWKVVPVGPDPASAADFDGGQLPSGIAIVPKHGPDSQEVYIKARAMDDHVTEANEQFRIELTDAAGTTVWGRAEPNRNVHGFLINENPKAVVYTIHDTERDCARPGEGSGFTLSAQERRGTYWLVVEQPERLNQCAYIGWRYLDDTLPNPHPDAEVFLQGMAYFSSDEDSAALGGFQQWFDLGIPFDEANAGRRVRIAWALSSDRPAVAALTLPARRGD